MKAENYKLNIKPQVDDKKELELAQSQKAEIEGMLLPPVAPKSQEQPTRPVS